MKDLIWEFYAEVQKNLHHFARRLGVYPQSAILPHRRLMVSQGRGVMIEGRYTTVTATSRDGVRVAAIFDVATDRWRAQVIPNDRGGSYVGKTAKEAFENAWRDEA